MVAQENIVTVLSIAKIKDTTVFIEAIVLDVHLKRRGPAPVPVGEINPVVSSIELDTINPTSRTLRILSIC